MNDLRKVHSKHELTCCCDNIPCCCKNCGFDNKIISGSPLISTQALVEAGILEDATFNERSSYSKFYHLCIIQSKPAISNSEGK